MMRGDGWNDFAIAVLVVVVTLLVGDCIWLHVKCARQESALAAVSVKLDGLDERQTRTNKAVLGLENWVETSSVQGRLKTYRRQLSEEGQKISETVKGWKDSTVKAIESAKTQWNAINDKGEKPRE